VLPAAVLEQAVPQLTLLLPPGTVDDDARARRWRVDGRVGAVLRGTRPAARSRQTAPIALAGVAAGHTDDAGDAQEGTAATATDTWPRAWGGFAIAIVALVAGTVTTLLWTRRGQRREATALAPERPDPGLP
jgi:hypothetical protein